VLTVACVEWGDYLQRGTEYVLKLRSMVERHLSMPHRFVCLTDSVVRRPGVEGVGLTQGRDGWWNKVELFRTGLFSGRVIAIDLDTVIVGSLDRLVETKGTVHLIDWGWTHNAYGNGVMVWDAGEHEEIWTRFTPEVPRRLRGDNDWLYELGGWDALPDGMNCSYRYHAVEAPPAGAVTVSMHGRPKPHEITRGWVPREWR
jgi:hypothetical protein